MGAVLALVFSAMFSGAALYIVIAEHPARSLLAPRDQLAQWKPSYSRGAVMQASLALASSILGLIVWVRDYPPSWLWLAGSGFMAGPIVWTFALMWALNGRIKRTPPDQASDETSAMLRRWGRLHAGRTLLGVAGLICYAAAQAELLAFTSM